MNKDLETEEYLRTQLQKAGVPEEKIEELVEELCRQPSPSIVHQQQD